MHSTHLVLCLVVREPDQLLHVQLCFGHRLHRLGLLLCQDPFRPLRVGQVCLDRLQVLLQVCQDSLLFRGVFKRPVLRMTSSYRILHTSAFFCQEN